jgi:effector-binding domain-containing protein
MTPDPPVAELIDLAATPTAVIRDVVAVSELAPFFDRAFGSLAAVTSAQAVAITGPAFARYHGAPRDTADLEVGFPTARPIEPAGEAVAGELPRGRAARLVHLGGYDQLAASWGRLADWMGEQGLEPAASFWEIYVTEPSPDMDPHDLRTELVWPVAG